MFCNKNQKIILIRLSEVFQSLSTYPHLCFHCVKGQYKPLSASTLNVYFHCIIVTDRVYLNEYNIMLLLIALI